MRTFAVLLTLAFALTLAEEEPAAAGSEPEESLTAADKVTCFRCGIGDICPFPWDEEGVETTECDRPKSCYKFDGHDIDGKRVILRDCGYFEAGECADQKDFENMEGVDGQICHCLEGSCNGAPGKVPVNGLNIVGLLSIALLMLKYY